MRGHHVYGEQPVNKSNANASPGPKRKRRKGTSNGIARPAPRSPQTPLTRTGRPRPLMNVRGRERTNRAHRRDRCRLNVIRSKRMERTKRSACMRPPPALPATGNAHLVPVLGILARLRPERHVGLHDVARQVLGYVGLEHAGLACAGWERQRERVARRSLVRLLRGVGGALRASGEDGAGGGKGGDERVTRD